MDDNYDEDEEEQDAVATSGQGVAIDPTAIGDHVSDPTALPSAVPQPLPAASEAESGAAFRELELPEIGSGILKFSSIFGAPPPTSAASTAKKRARDELEEEEEGQDLVSPLSAN